MKLTLLKENRSFCSLWIGQLISALGDRLTQMGILTFVMVLSKDDGSKMALITFFSLLPFLLFGPIFGAIADRNSRKKIMILTDVLRAGLVVLIPIVWTNTHSIALIIMLVFVLGALSALFSPAKMSIIANITDKDDFLEANSLIVTTGTVATLVGTLLAGVLIKISGIKAGFYINSLTYLISAFFILNISYHKPPAGKKIAFGDNLLAIFSALYTFLSAKKEENTNKALIKDIKIGMKYIWRHNIVKQLIALSAVFAFISSFAYILILNYSANTLKQNSLGTGMLLSSAGLGMVAGSLILIKRKDKVKYKRALYLSYLIVGVFCLAFLSKPSFHASLAILFCAGIGASIFTIAMDTVLQRIIPDELKGKIFSASGIVSNAVFLLCLLLVGFLLKVTSSVFLFGLIGITGLVSALAIFLSDKLWGYQLFRMFLRLVMRILFNFKVSGLLHISAKRKVIFAGNHTSLIDGIALMCAYPQRVYFLAADFLFKETFLGWCAKKLGYIPIRRAGFNKESIRQAVEILHSGHSLCIFPEGKITQDGRLTEGKAGVALIAKLAQADVVPFAIEGAYEAWPVPKKYPRRFPVEIRFGAPVEIKEYPVPDELVKEVMQDIGKIKLELEREGYLRVSPGDIISHLINIG